MCNSTNKVDYRKIYEQHYGPIPKDEFGQSFDIHHIDGDRTNNDPTNLRAVSLQDHLEIHMSQGDWGACLAIFLRMNSTKEELSQMARQMCLARVAAGTHPWSGLEFNKRKVEQGIHHFLGGEIQKRVTAKRLAQGTHHFQTMTPEQRKQIQINRLQKGVHPFSGANNPCYKQLEQGTHNFQGENHPMKRRSREGSHPWTTPKVCPHCGKVGKGGVMNRFHFDKCKLKE